MDFSELESELPTFITSDEDPSSIAQNLGQDSGESTMMAICTDGSRCGCAIYRDSIVFLVADRRDSGDPYKSLDLTIQKINPKLVIVSSVQKRLITFLEKRFYFDILDISRKDSKGADCTQASTKTSSISTLSDLNNRYSEKFFTLVIVPNVWFSISRSMQKLLESEFVESKKLDEMEDKSLFITSKIEKSTDVCAVRSIAALDAYSIYAFTISQTVEANNPTLNTQSTLFLQNATQKSANTNELKDDAKNLMPILDVRYLDPGPVLSLDKFTIESLSIFHQRSTKSKDNLTFMTPEEELDEIPSLYEVLNQCQSLQGQKNLRTMMLWPLQDINELNHRLDIVEYFMSHDNKLLVDQLLVHLKNVVPLSALLNKLNQSVGTYKDLSKLYKALWAFTAIIDIIKTDNSPDLEIFNRIEKLNCVEFRAVVDSIVNIVDFEASMRQKRVQVLLGVDQNVDQKKEIIDNLTMFLDEVGIEETGKYRDLLGKTCKISYIPRIGFLNSIQFSSASELLQLRLSKEIDVLLHTEQSVYFKTPRMEELDNNAGDIACDLIDLEQAVLIELQDNLLRFTDLILRLMEICGELDCLIAFAKVSSQRCYIRPEFVASDDEMDIQQAYHPLHCIRSNIVPNNVRFYNASAQRKVKLMILTGPNSCGKSTYMKAACLVVYMAHIGCFVPATLAKIPIVDAIYTRMHSANSISTGLSSFATDLHQINYAISRATQHSLIAIDEFGKGTRARDGFYLLKGLISYFAEETQNSPYVMFTTHFNRLVNHLQNYSEYILYNTFKVTQDQAKDSIVYEYRLMEGVGEDSLADKVAAKAGISQKIIDRASQIRDHITGRESIRCIPPSGA